LTIRQEGDEALAKAYAVVARRALAYIAKMPGLRLHDQDPFLPS